MGPRSYGFGGRVQNAKGSEQRRDGGRGASRAPRRSTPTSTFLLRDIVGARAHQRVTSFMKQQMRVRDYINKKEERARRCVCAGASGEPCVLGGHTLNSRQLVDSIGKL